jgi:lysophospholipase L1-like esterase
MPHLASEAGQAGRILSKTSNVISPNSTILFQGDSITDCGRNRDADPGPNARFGLGQGYALIAAAELLGTRPSDGLRFFNRGISGNRIVDLYARILSDTINLKPDILSILIGVNDTWHGKEHSNGVSVPKFERVYREFLSEVRTALPGVKFVLCEPFVLRCGVVGGDWVDEIDQRRGVVAKLSREFGSVLVPFQSVFDEAVKTAPPEYWAADGVHPSPAGHHLMAKCWLEKVARI